MSLLSVLNLVGYSMGAALHLWMAALVSRRNHPRSKVERVLVFLAISVGIWHAANLVLTLHTLLGLDKTHWTQLLRAADTAAVICVTFCYSFLLHIHLHLWAQARGRALTYTERVRVYLSYLPPLFLCNAVPRLWLGDYAPMLLKLENLVLPFALWSAYVLALIAVTDLLIARMSSSTEEKRIMRTLAVSFLGVGVLILLVHAFNFSAGTILFPYLDSLANLSSLLPSALLAYYIYRYHYLELAIKESLVIASFAAVVLVVYLFGIRTVGGWLTARWELNQGSVEALMIVGLALTAAPLRRWLDRRFHHLFAREAALYRDVLASIGVRAGEYKTISEMITFIEQRTAQALGLNQVRIVAFGSWLEQSSDVTPENKIEPWLTEVLQLSQENDWSLVEDDKRLEERGYRIAYPLRREDHAVGLMLVGANEGVLSFESRSVLEILAGQITVAIEEKRLIEENIQLERKLAHGERLSALGEMAATIAHEVKNPLSSIKSIAQVMGEDEKLRREYGRDIDLIVGETDRLNRSVTQLLSFARPAPPSERTTLDQLIRTTVDLLRAEAVNARVAVEVNHPAKIELESTTLAALKDALTNLLINAIHATPPGGEVRVETEVIEEVVKITVIDEGPGISPELERRIWDPFFTTRQRGTGLGLAIVRKRMQEIDGSAHLLSREDNHRGARFVLTFSRTNKIR